MKRFIIHLFIISLPILLIIGYPMLRMFMGNVMGDISKTGIQFFDSSYASVYGYQPSRTHRVILTDNYARDTRRGLQHTVFVIGDSFSQQGSRSFMEYLQDYMPSWEVMNARTFLNEKSEWVYVHTLPSGKKVVFNHMLEYVDYLLSHEKDLPSVIVVESEEYAFLNRLFTMHSDSGLELTEEYSEDSNLRMANTQMDKIGSETTLFSALDFSFKWYKRLFNIEHSNKCDENMLDDEYFSCPCHENKLYTVRLDVCVDINTIGQQVMKKEALVRKAKERNVTLLFFICPAKYRMYYSHIVNKENAPDNITLFDYLIDKDTDDCVINNREILMPYVERKEKDIYFCNDTHWSYKAADITAKALAERIVNI